MQSPIPNQPPSSLNATPNTTTAHFPIWRQNHFEWLRSPKANPTIPMLVGKKEIDAKSYLSEEKGPEERVVE